MFTHSQVFADEAARDAYVPHPEHQKVVQLLLPLLAKDGLVVFDYMPHAKL